MSSKAIMTVRNIEARAVTKRGVRVSGCYYWAPELIELMGDVVEVDLSQTPPPQELIATIGHRIITLQAEQILP